MEDGDAPREKVDDDLARWMALSARAASRTLRPTVITLVVAMGFLNCRSGSSRSSQASEVVYSTALASTNATQVARNGSLNRPDPAATIDLNREKAFARALISALEGYDSDLNVLTPPARLGGENRAMIKATEELISDARALLAGLDSGAVTEHQIAQLAAVERDYTAFEAACANLNPDFACGTLIERLLQRD